MTNEAIYDAITDVSDELIAAADAHVLRKKPRRMRWAAAAAVLFPVRDEQMEDKENAA